MVHSGELQPSPELVSWAGDQLRSDEERTEIAGAFESSEDTRVLALGELRYCVVPLYHVGGIAGPATALVLGFRNIEPRIPPPDVLAILASHIR